MTTITESVLLESQSARSAQLERVSNPKAEELLNRAKALVFIAKDSFAIALTGAIAEYFEVSEDTVTKSARRHRDEFLLDGLRLASHKDARFATDKMSDANALHEKTRRVLLWTPRAALRLGMLLRDSEVAKSVRTLLLDIVSGSQEVHLSAEFLDSVNRANQLASEISWFKENNPAMLTQLLSMSGCSTHSSQTLELLDTYGLLSNRMGLAFNKQLKAIELCNDATSLDKVQQLKREYVEQVQEITKLEAKVKKLQSDLKKAEVVIDTWKNRAEGLEMVIKRDNSSLGIVEPKQQTGKKAGYGSPIVTPPPSSSSYGIDSCIVPINNPFGGRHDH